MTAEQVTIRPCQTPDLEHFGLFGSDLHVAYCRDEFAKSSVVILVAVSDEDVPVGKLHLHLDHGDGAAWLEAACVALPLRNRGIGTSLMRAAEAFVAEHGLDTMELGVEDSNPKARRLYERLGYRSVARNDFQYVGAPVPNPGVVMRKTLA